MFANVTGDPSWEMRSSAGPSSDRLDPQGKSAKVVLVLEALDQTLERTWVDA